MLFLLLFVLLPMLNCAQGEGIPASGDENTWVIRQASPTESPTLPPPYLHLPMFVDSETMMVDKEHFSPVKGTGQEPLPEPVRQVLLPLRNRFQSAPLRDPGVFVEVSCSPKTMRVRVDRKVLGRAPHLHVKLGTCEPNEYTKDYLYFEYDSGKCGSKRTVSSNI